MLPVRLGNNRNIYSLEKLLTAALAPSLFHPVLPISVANRDGAAKGLSLVQSPVLLLVRRIFSERQTEQSPDLPPLLRYILSLQCCRSEPARAVHSPPFTPLGLIGPPVPPLFCSSQETVRI